MNTDNRYVVVLIALLMTVSLVGASAAVAVDRTVLDADHLSETVGEEGVYEELAADAQENISEQIDENLDENSSTRPDGVTFDFDSEEIATKAVTAEFFADEFSRNFEQFIAFLNGERDELELWIDLAPVYDSVSEQFTAESISVDTVAVAQGADLQSGDADVEITDEMLAALNEDEDGYQSVRVDIRSQGAQDLPVDFTSSGAARVDTVTLAQDGDLNSASSEIEVTDSMIERLNEDEEGYQSVRVDIRSQGVGTLPVEFNQSGGVRIDTVTLAQDSDLNAASSEIEVTDPMIERLNEDAEGYENVRRDIREQARESLPARATDEQVDQVLREANEEMKANARERARTEYGANVSDETLQDIVALQNTVIDGLTAPGFDSFDEYESQRDADERALERSLDDEIDTSLQETNEDVKADAAEQARTEYGEDVGDETLQDIVALQNTVIDGLTDPELASFEEYASQRDADERALERSLDDEIDTSLQETNEDVKADAAEQARTEYGEDVGNETLQDMIALQDTVIDGLTDPELESFEEYETRRDSSEEALETSLAAEIRDQINEDADGRVNLSGGFGEENSQISTMRSGVGLVSLSVVALPVAFLLLIGALYAATRSLPRTGRTTGVALIVAGVVGAIGGLVARGPATSAIEPDTGSSGTAEAVFGDALVSVFESLFSTLVTQSAVLTVVGLGLVGAVYAKRMTSEE